MGTRGRRLATSHQALQALMKGHGDLIVSHTACEGQRCWVCMCVRTEMLLSGMLESGGQDSQHWRGVGMH